MTDQPPQFPQYPPAGTPIADKKQAAPLQKMIGKMFGRRVATRTKGLTSNQNVKITARKVKFY